MGSPLGAEKSAAAKTGLTLDAWRGRRAAGERWCYRCRCWHELSSMRGKVCAPCNSAKAARSRYRLTEREYAELDRRTCPICQRSGEKMELDHNHKTGAARAWLCSRCNGALGQFCDDEGLLRRAIEYLESHADG